MKILHHNFPDPAKAKGTQAEISAEFKRVREMIKSYYQEFITQNL